MARDGISQRLQDDRSGEHQAGNADAGCRDRQEGWLALRLCREFARASGRPGKHALLELPGAAHRALRLLHHGLLPHASRLLPVLRRQYSRTVGYRVSRADYRASFRAPLTSAVECAPSADLLRSYADRSLPSPAQLFGHLVWRHFFADLQLCDPRVATYLSALLTDFTHADNLYRIRDAQGRRPDDVGEMLIESNPLLEASSFDRERQVRKHIGDYTLFMTGISRRTWLMLAAVGNCAWMPLWITSKRERNPTPSCLRSTNLNTGMRRRSSGNSRKTLSWPFTD